MILSFCLSLALFYAAESCTTKSKLIEIPINHPAKPQAPEISFEPPANSGFTDNQDE